MTTTDDARQVVCPSCTVEHEPDARFCDECGTALAGVVPEQRRTSPHSVPFRADRAPVRGPGRAARHRWAWAVALVLVVAGLVATTAIRAGSAPDVPAVPTPVTPVPAPPLDPQQQLVAQARVDAPTAEAAVGWWLPQLSAKKGGLEADGITYNAATVLADHQQRRAANAGAFLVWSGDYSSFTGRDFWVTLVARPFATSDEANAWCASAGFGVRDCYAKRLSHGGESPTANTRQRAGR